MARAVRPKLAFISAEKASTENIAVTVAGEDGRKADDGTARAASALEVRFAPSESSPVIFRLPPGSSYEEVAKSGSWRRISSPRGVGWIHVGR